MTAQMPDLIIVGGEELLLLCNPLDHYFRITGRPSPFRNGGTALWRGYVATWSIDDGRLWLTDVPNAAQLFPDRSLPIPATWYTGTLRIGRGDILEYVHMGYGSVHAQEEYLEVQAGRVVARHIMDGYDVLRHREERSLRSARRVAGWAGVIAVVSGVVLRGGVIATIGSWLRWVTAGALALALVVFGFGLQGYRTSRRTLRRYERQRRESAAA